MNFLLTDEHELLQSSLRRLLVERSPRAELRRRAEARLPVDDAVWSRSAELGITGMLADEERGGFGASTVEVMVLSAEWGRALQLGSMIDTNIAVAALDRVGASGPTERYLDDLVQGRRRASWCYASADGSTAAPPVKAEPADNGGYRLRGTVGFAMDAAHSSLLLVSASSANGPLLLLVPADTEGVSVGAPRGLDLTRPVSEVTFDAAFAGDDCMVSSGEEALELAEWLSDVAAVLACADSLGATEMVITDTVAYSKERIAFGRPIASYQAIKHHCADMVLAYEKSTVATWQAAIAVRDCWPDRRRAVAIAKSITGPACSTVVSQALQIFGGIGFTWEHDLHLFLRRAKMDEVLFGDARHHRSVLASVGF
jgi:alkylation response protein AidB-like acyl-CoA dehydrogenase